ncbi:sucrase ferredoxin [Mycolicibacterium madagascariense]|uniref:Sucrase ferredoxin n=1 Tax=Mycolicibacterium madagascariense TaxID=212765 RepID=A0A7I7XER5_9MYCO|nr:sucrase ferredoxin [Mycolicibacterium madagascariense]MCV7015379.1 sucrase ferredoxin [Mycolicibacterium madagascariense]BBZ27677.1 sucrase ferredoxin [Mycolicibacterium madagascariense]
MSANDVSKPPPCSDQSRARNDPLYGTASAGRSWVLLELAGPWGRSAFLNSPAVLDPALGRAIARRFETAGLRIAAIRRPGRRSATPRWRWFIAQSEEGSEALHHGEVDGPQDYLDVAIDGSDGRPVDGPLVAVCAHGKHDQCCAVRGRAATKAIAERYPEATWECSHLGGDRFAATMLVLPEGLCYGRVDATDAAGLIGLYLDGRLDDAFLRGRTSLPHAVQAAQHFARERSGEDRIAALSPLAVRHVDHDVHVTLAADGGPVEVVLTEQVTEPLRSTCHSSIPGPVRTFALVSIGSP